MIRLGGTASNSHMAAFRGISRYFQRRGIDLDWLLYSDYDPLVDAFVAGEVDLAWNGPLSYVKIKRRLRERCTVIAMRDVDVNFVTHFITHASSDIATVEDLRGKSFAFGSRGSVEAGLLAHHFLKQLGINPRRDLAASTFYDERRVEPIPGFPWLSDQEDIIQRVSAGEYDAGAVSAETLRSVGRRGSPGLEGIRTFWSSPGYSHCCFTAHSDMDGETSHRITQAFLSMGGRDPVAREVLEAEGCTAFVPGIQEGWEAVEIAAEEEGLI